MFSKKIIGVIYLFVVTILHADIGGIVYQDLPVNNHKLNSYGIKDSNELGVAGVRVTAYMSDDTNTSTVTDSNGSWLLHTQLDARVEFTNLPSYLQESSSGNLHNSSVQFVKDGDLNVTFGLHNPDDYSDTANPLYVNNLQQNGTHIGSNLQSLHTVHYLSEGLNANYQDYNHIQGTGERPKDTILMEDIGSVWGKAYQKDKKRLFVASMLQRHMGFANSPADIYVVDYSSGLPASLIGHFSLQGITPANGGTKIDLGSIDRVSGDDYELYDDPLKQNRDLDAYAKVGKISFGGIDIDNNRDILWVVNLNQRGIISIDVSKDIHSSSVKQYLIDNFPNKPECKNGDTLRPWALKIHEDRGYLGLVCDGSKSQSNSDMSAYVLSFDLQNPYLGFTQIISLPLDYKREYNKWFPWSDQYIDPSTVPLSGVYHGTPILSDIVFDKYNNIYLAFMDRYATQLQQANYPIKHGAKEENVRENGEILKFCNENGTYIVEGNGNCTQNYDANDSNISEFFNDQGGDTNQEASFGSLAILKGSNELLLTTLDPHPESSTGKQETKYFYIQGESRLSLKDGSIQGWYAHAYTATAGMAYKGNGIGDVELLTPSAPIEIGDRVWSDDNKNGIQDINEKGISGVVVKLIKDNLVIDTATTDSDGYYIFSSLGNSKIEPNKQYLISIDLNNTKLNDKNITIYHQRGLIGSSYLNDSDGIKNGNSIEANISSSDISISGVNNHSFDFGFISNSSTPTPTPTPSSTYIPISTFTPTLISSPTPILSEGEADKVCFGDMVWDDENRNGLQDEGEQGIPNVKVTLYSRDCTTEINSTITDNNGKYNFSNLDIGDYCVGFSEFPTNYMITFKDEGLNDLLDSDVNRDTNKTDVFALNSLENDECNISIDMGLYSRVGCGGDELSIQDDTISANTSDSKTVINVLSNDSLDIEEQQIIKLISYQDGKEFWDRNSTDRIVSSMLTDRLVVDGEGVWSVENDKIVFNAYNSFNGKVPTPIYYVIERFDCNAIKANGLKIVSNIAQVSIVTPCTCKGYSSSIPSMNILSSLLLFLFVSIYLFFINKEL